MPDLSFTFILPALNAAGPLFERALASIREQRYPTELVEILVADGGSTDTTRRDAERHGARVIENPNRLAEWGVKEGMLVAAGEIVVVFAADNELVGTRLARNRRIAVRSETPSSPPSTGGSSPAPTTRR